MTSSTIKHFLILVALVIGFSLPAHAGWQLDAGPSTLNFISTKKNSVAEVHAFTGLSGRVSNGGEAELNIDLSSVATGIELRDERMRKFLFEVGGYPRATVKTTVEMQKLEKLSAGQAMEIPVTVSLALHGVSRDIQTRLRVTGLANDRFAVTTVKPLVINAADFGLVGGVHKLAELAGLPVISTAVPVTFNLVYKQD